jgi:hypothetical protein
MAAPGSVGCAWLHRTCAIHVQRGCTRYWGRMHPCSVQCPRFAPTPRQAPQTQRTVNMRAPCRPHAKPRPQVEGVLHDGPGTHGGAPRGRMQAGNVKPHGPPQPHAGGACRHRGRRRRRRCSGSGTGSGRRRGVGAGARRRRGRGRERGLQRGRGRGGGGKAGGSGAKNRCIRGGQVPVGRNTRCTPLLRPPVALSPCCAAMQI